MALRDRVQGAEVFEPGVEAPALDLLAADRVRAVEHDHLHAGPPGHAHGQCHRGRIRVVARADILDVEHQCVETVELFHGWRERVERLAVETDLGQPADRVTAGADLDHVLRGTANAMLGAKQPP